MYYNIENSFSKLHKTPQPKVEVKKEGNIIELKRQKTEITIPKGVVQDSEKDFLKMATSDKFILSIGNKSTGKVGECSISSRWHSRTTGSTATS